MSLPKEILPLVTSAEVEAFNTIGGEERMIDFINRFRNIEREQIIKLLDTSRQCTCSPACKTDVNVVAFVLEELKLNLMDLIRGKI